MPLLRALATRGVADHRRLAVAAACAVAFAATPALGADGAAVASDPTPVVAAVDPTAAALPAAPPVATAGPPAPQAVAVAAAAPAPQPSPWRGSALTWRNLASLPTVAPGYEQTYNPTIFNALMIVPQFDFGDGWFVRGWQYATFEYTNADDTTQRHEWVPSDTLLSVGKRWRLPAGVGASANANLTLPTSKLSQMRTLAVGFGAGGALQWSRGIVSAAYVARVSAGVFRSQTGEFASPWLASCPATPQGCEPFSTTGRRNPKWGAMNIVNLALQPFDSLGFSVAAGLFHAVLYPLPTGTVDTAFGPAEIAPRPTNTDLRVVTYWGLGAEWAVTRGVAVGAGAETYNPQLTLASTYEAPFFNRYTNFYVEIQVQPVPLWAALTGQTAAGGASRPDAPTRNQ